MEAWINPTDYANYNGILGKTNSNLPAPFDLYLTPGNGTPVFYYGDGASHYSNLNGALAPATGAWSHIVVVSSGSFASATLTQYLNGATNGTTTLTGFTAADTNNSIKIASRNDLVTMFTSTDEVRISSTARSAGWIATEYSNQNAPSTFSPSARRTDVRGMSQGLNRGPCGKLDKVKLSVALEILQSARHHPNPFNITLACGFTPLHLQTFLAAHLQVALPDRRVEIKTGLFGDLAGTLERAAGSDAVAIVIEWPDLDARLGYRGRAGGDQRKRAT